MPVLKPKFVVRGNEKFVVLREYQQEGAARYYLARHASCKLTSRGVGRSRRFLVLRRVG